jgi:hypothetical protein
MSLLAINWEPQIRGIIIIIIAVGVLMGSVYLILATNLGARLGFLVSFAALAGWIFLMGTVWWTYGKGLLGPDPSWQPVRAKTVLQSPVALNEAGVLKSPVVEPPTKAPIDVAQDVDAALRAEKWKELLPAATTFAQAGAAATVLLEESGAFAAGQFQVVAVFERGGERSPQLFDGELDFLAFFHKPHYALVEVAPLIEQRAEPGRAPAKAVIDPTQPHQYVYMIRDLGARREPAGFITVGSLVVFLVLCYLLHTRDRQVEENKAAKAIPEKTSVSV